MCSLDSSARPFSFRTHGFNGHLYREGLKRLRVMGTAAVAVSLLGLIPAIVDALRHGGFFSGRPPTQIVSPADIGLPLLILLFFTPLLFFTQFSFLQKRKDSDFFHALPYTRTCLFVSLVAATLTVVVLAEILLAILSVSLYGMRSDTVFLVSEVVRFTLLSILASAMLGGFMMIALTLSGTKSAATLLFFLFAGSVRATAFVFGMMLETIPLLDPAAVSGRFFTSHVWNLPLLLLTYSGNGDSQRAAHSLPILLYSAAVTVGLYLIEWYLFRRRRSEDAGHPLSPIRQIVFRSLFILPIGLLTVAYAVQDLDMPWIPVAILISALALYLLFDLIMTRQPKRLIRSLPWLLVPAFCCAALFGTFTLIQERIWNESLLPGRIESVHLYSRVSDTNAYRDILLKDLFTDDGTVIQAVSDIYEANRREKDRSPSSLSPYPDLKSNGDDDAWQAKVAFRMKDGRVLYRRICMSGIRHKNLYSLYCATDAYRTVASALPDSRQILSVTAGDISVDKESFLDVWKQENHASPDTRILTTQIPYMVQIIGHENGEMFYIPLPMIQSRPVMTNFIVSCVTASDTYALTFPESPDTKPRYFRDYPGMPEAIDDFRKESGIIRHEAEQSHPGETSWTTVSMKMYSLSPDTETWPTWPVMSRHDSDFVCVTTGSISPLMTFLSAHAVQDATDVDSYAGEALFLLDLHLSTAGQTAKDREAEVYLHACGLFAFTEPDMEEFLRYFAEKA